MVVQVCPVCHMVLSASGLCSLCGSASIQSINKESALIESESISLPFDLETLPESTSRPPLPFGIKDAPNHSVESPNTPANAKEATGIAESTSKKPISINEKGQNKAIELPYGIDHMHNTLID